MIGNTEQLVHPSSAAADDALQSAQRRSSLKLGFLTNVPFSSDVGGAKRGLQQAIETFEYAEELGFDSGWVRQRHFDNYISSPLVLLAAVAQHTSRIRLGTGVMTVSYEDPIRLAEDASTVDLLSDGRLELGMAAGNNPFDAVFGGSRRAGREEGHERIRRLRDAIAGKPLPILNDDAATDLPDLFVRPRSPQLGDRLWYGSGSATSAARTGSLGLGLLLSTLNLEPTSQSFDESQRDNIVAYKAAFDDADRTPRVCVSRLFMPAVNARQRERYAEFDRIRRAEGPAGPRPKGALEPGTLTGAISRSNGTNVAENGLPSNVQLCEIHHGDPERVLAAAQADQALALADELMVWLPPNFTLSENKELLENTVEWLAEPLGWNQTSSRNAAQNDHPRFNATTPEPEIAE